MDCLTWLRNIVDVWEILQLKLYDSNSRPGQQLLSQSSPGDLTVVEGQRIGKFSQNSKLGYSCVRAMKGKPYDSLIRDHVIVHLSLNVGSSTHNCCWCI